VLAGDGLAPADARADESADHETSAAFGRALEQALAKMEGTAAPAPAAGRTEVDGSQEMENRGPKADGQ